MISREHTQYDEQSITNVEEVGIDKKVHSLFSSRTAQYPLSIKQHNKLYKPNNITFDK